MAYEFIAAGLKPATPVKSFIDSYMSGKEFQQNQEINRVNIEGADKRNELVDIQLKSAKKQMDAENQWSKLPRSEDGTIDPQAEQQFKSAFPEYYDTRKKAAVEEERGQLGLTVDKLNVASALFKNVKTDEQAVAAEKYAQDNFGLTLKRDPAVFGAVSKYSSELANKIQLINDDMATAAASGDWETVKLLKDARVAETQLAQYEVLKLQTESERNRAAAQASGAQGYKYFQQGIKAAAEAEAEPILAEAKRVEAEAKRTAAETKAKGSASGMPRDKVNLRKAEQAVMDLDGLMSQIPSVEKAIRGEALGAMNIGQRAASKAANPILTLFGDPGVTATAQEFGDAQTIRQFKKAVQIAFINNPKFPVEEQKKVDALFNEIDPDKITSAKGTALIPLMEILTVLRNQREKSAAFLEDREPEYIERPRTGDKIDPIVPDMEKDDPALEEYLAKNGAKKDMWVQWPDGSRSQITGEK